MLSELLAMDFSRSHKNCHGHLSPVECFTSNKQTERTFNFVPRHKLHGIVCARVARYWGTQFAGKFTDCVLTESRFCMILPCKSHNSLAKSLYLMVTSSFLEVISFSGPIPAAHKSGWINHLAGGIPCWWNPKFMADWLVVFRHPSEKYASSSVGMLFHDPNCFWNSGKSVKIPWLQSAPSWNFWLHRSCFPPNLTIPVRS